MIVYAYALFNEWNGVHVAQKVSVTFACDYDSKEIPEGEQLTRAFSLDGRDYEIDLCERHSQKFDEGFTRFVGHARKVTGRVTRTKRRTAANHQHSAEVRAQVCAPLRQPEWRHAPRGLAGNAEGLTARRQDAQLRAVLQQALCKLATGVDQVLTVIEH